jgi:AcrR family transcriptional regulator
MRLPSRCGTRERGTVGAVMGTKARRSDERGDPRIARTRATVLGTAADLVVEQGPTALTVDAVVARSGVARSTIYRHWPTRDDLLVDVFDFCVPEISSPPPDLGFEDAMRFFLHDLVRQMSDPKWSRMMPAMLALKAYEPTLADVEQRLERRQDTVSAELFARAVAEGLIDETVDQNQLIARLIGPLIFAVLTNETPLTTGLADASLAGVMATLRR